MLALKRLSLGVFLIAGLSALLLFSDTNRMRGEHRLPRIAIFQHASTPVLDDGVRGMIAGLADQGFVDGSTAVITYFNAEGDITTANTISQAVVNGQFDLVITCSTPSMQAFANANRDGKVMHVFGLVADPFSAGVGLDRTDPLKHPRHFVGVPTATPTVRDSFQLARRCQPGLKTVGVVWNPAESNSQYFTETARNACKELGIELLEANADNPSAVLEACNSLLTRGAQAIWVGGDNAVNAALDVVISSARRGGVPVFSILPGKPERGTMLDIGLDFFVVGKMTGDLAGKILRGEDAAKMPIRDVSDLMPHFLVVNTTAMKGLKENWRAPDDLLKEANITVDEAGVHRKGAK